MIKVFENVFFKVIFNGLKIGPLYVLMCFAMDKKNLEQLFPALEPGLYEEIIEHATIKEFKAGETLLRVGQPIRSTMLIVGGFNKALQGG
jgi:hypothetical protein